MYSSQYEKTVLGSGMVSEPLQGWGGAGVQARGAFHLGHGLLELLRDDDVAGRKDTAPGVDANVAEIGMEIPGTKNKWVYGKDTNGYLVTRS